MVRALRVVTVERGVDPRRFALLPFGGAGPMHAAEIAAELGIERILCPRAGGVLSALGLCASDRRRDTTRTVMLERQRPHGERGRRRGRRADRSAGRRGARRRRARSRLRDALRRPGLRAAGARLRPTRTRPTWPSASPPPTRSATATAIPTAKWCSSISAWRWSRPASARNRPPRPQGSSQEGRREVHFDGEWIETPVLRGEPPAGLRRRGPGDLRAARGDLRRCHPAGGRGRRAGRSSGGQATR